MHPSKPLLAAALLSTLLPLAACTAAPAPEARVIVRIAPSAHPEAYDVHLAEAGVGFRSQFSMRSGQTRTVPVPKGWVSVRIAGLCVVPADTAGTLTIEVRPNDCRIV
ncbi:MAG: hypothetical protein HIU86_09100 [Acidobacteria bacterium]|nr:hypothetical protein [Acidobacteriota bacterium]